jgi:hypothetical protein
MKVMIKKKAKLIAGCCVSEWVEIKNPIPLIATRVALKVLVRG